MKKLYSTQNLTKAMYFGTAMAIILSNVSPIFAANLAITGGNTQSTNGTDVVYLYGSHGSIVFAGDDNYCGVDKVVDRGGSSNTASPITAEEQYNRFIENKEFSGRNPYGTMMQKATWQSDGVTTNNGGYMGSLTSGSSDVLPEAYGIYSFVTGCGAYASGNYSTAFGAGATTKAGGAQAFGVSALASGKAGIAMGVGSEASGDSTVAIGGLAVARGESSIALGTKATATVDYAIAVGLQASAKAKGAIAIGSAAPLDDEDNGQRGGQATAKDEYAIAIGAHSYAETFNSIAIGAGAQVSAKDGVAVGGGSRSTTEHGVLGYDPIRNDTKQIAGDADIVWKSTAGAFSIGDADLDITRQLTGVAAGSKDTDAVNVAQLKAMRKLILVEQKDETAPITIGSATDGTEINIKNSSSEARTISGVKAAKNNDEAVNKEQLDEEIANITEIITDIQGVNAFAVLYDKKAGGVVDYESVTLGLNNHVQPVALHNVKDGMIEARSNDAINGGQMHAIFQDVAQYFGGGAEFRQGKFFNPQYNVTSISTDGTMVPKIINNVSDSLVTLDLSVKSVYSYAKYVNDNLTDKIDHLSNNALLWNEDSGAFVALHGTREERKKSKITYLSDGEISFGSMDAITGNQLYLMGDQIAQYFGGGAKYENGQWTNPNFKVVQVDVGGAVGGKINYSNVAEAFEGVNNSILHVNNRIAEIKNKVNNEDVLLWNQSKGAYDANRNGRAKKIINVADGKVQRDSTDAVNGGQLWKTNERVTNVEQRVNHIDKKVDVFSNAIHDIGTTVTNISNRVDNIENKYNGIVDGVVVYDKSEDGEKTNKVTLKGGDEGEPVLIDNVADGKIASDSKEAVNGGQLHDYTEQQMQIILDNSKNYTDRRVNNIVVDAIDDAVDQSKRYTDMRFNSLNYGVENIRKEAKQAAAIGLAASNLRYNDTPGKLSIAFGSGLWRSQSAFALGAGYTSESGNIRSNLSVTTSGGHWGAGVGFNLTLN
ncbi:Vomp family autotransporter [Bartonella sp. B10]